MQAPPEFRLGGRASVAEPLCDVHSTDLHSVLCNFDGVSAMEWLCRSNTLAANRASQLKLKDIPAGPRCRPAGLHLRNASMVGA